MLDKLLEQIVPKTEFTFPSVISSIIVCFDVFGQKGGIVGGAVRDFVLNKEVRDYDVCIEASDNIAEDIREIKIHAARFGYTVQDLTVQDLTVSEDYDDAGLKIVLCLKKMGEHNVDILLISEKIEEFVQDFTCDISKIWYDVLQAKVILTLEFCKVVKTKVCTVNDNRDSHPNVTEKYVQKLEYKFEEYKFARF